MAPDNARQSITRASTVEIGLVLLICGGIAAGSAWATRISIGQDHVRAELLALRQEVRTGTGDRWTGNNMRHWVEATNREIEIWSRAAEQTLNLEPGTWQRFKFPDPSNTK